MRSRIATFLAEHTTVTLATVGPDGAPAAAAVFYAADDGLNLYFLSEERTQHGPNLLAHPRVAGTIQADGQDWRASAACNCAAAAPVSAGTNSRTRRRSTGASCLRRRAAGRRRGPGVLAGPLARARFWVLRPAWFRLIDNTVRFGFKEELVLDE